MTMNERRGMVIQERDRNLLRELAVMRVIDREQAKKVAGFQSTTRANYRLLLLTRAGLLRRFFLGTRAGGAKALYSLSEKGARCVEVPYRGLRRPKDKALIADFFVQHQLAVNEIYCALKCGTSPDARTVCRRWLSFLQPLAPGLRLIPDGYAEFQTGDEVVALFLEVDLGHERLKVWKEKIQNYLQLALTGEFQRRFGQDRFRVLVIAHSEGRMFSIRKVVAALTEKIFWFSSLEAIERKSVFGPVWLRPRGEVRQPLFRETP